MVTVVLLSELLLYFGLRSLFDRTVIALQERAIEQAIEFSESHLAQIQNRAFSIAASNPIARILNQGYDIERDLEAVRYTVRQIGDLEGAVPDRYLVAVYCYSGHDDTVVTSSGFVGSGIFPHRATAEHVLRTQKYLTWHPVPPAEAGVASTDDAARTSSTIVFAVPIPLSYIGRRSHIAIVLDSAVIADSMALGSETAEFSYLVLNGSGEPLITRGDSDLLLSSPPAAESGGGRPSAGRDTQFSVVRTTEPLGWTYVIAANRGAFLHQAGLFRRFSGIVIAICVAAALLLSIPLAKLFYRPIRTVSDRLHSRLEEFGDVGEAASVGPLDRIERDFTELLDRNRRLYERFARDKEVLRDTFVRDVILGKLDDVDEIASEADYFDLSLAARRYACILVTYPAHVAASTKARQIFKTQAEDLLRRQEPISDGFCYVLGEPEYLVVLIGRGDTDSSEPTDDGSGNDSDVRMARRLHEQLSTTFGDAFQLCVGEAVASMDRLPLSFQDAARLYSHSRSAAGLSVLTKERLNVWPTDREATHRIQRRTEDFRTFLEAGNYAGAGEAVRLLMEDPAIAASVLFRQMKLTEMANLLVSHILYHLELTDFFPPNTNPWTDFLSLTDDESVRSWFSRVFEQMDEFLRRRERSSKEILAARIAERLERDYRSAVSFQGLSDELHVSPSYLSAVFKEVEGVTCTEYLVKLRVDAACRALLQSDKLVKEIAYDEGFGGKQNLIRSFKKAVGMTPTEYRRRHSGARIANHDT